MQEKENIFNKIIKLSLTGISRLFFIFGISLLIIQFLSIPALAETVEYHDGYNLIYHDDGSKEIINGALNFLRYDGEWRPKDELNIFNGSWPYLYSQNATSADFKVDDTILSIPKENTVFKTNLNSISYEIKYTKSELQGKGKSFNSKRDPIEIPYHLRSRKPKNEYKDKHNIKYGRFHFRAETQDIVIHDDTPRDYWEDGKVFQDVTYLLPQDYVSMIDANGKILLEFKNDSLNKLTGNVVIEVRTWDIIGANKWGGNVTFSQTTDVKATGNAELKQTVADYSLYTRFDEGNGKIIHNENIFNRPLGDLLGAVGTGTYTAGKYGQAIYFNGIDNKVLFKDDPAFRLAGDFTISYYLKQEQGVSNQDSDILRKGSTATASTKSWYKVELTNNLIHGSITKDGDKAVESYDTQERRDGLWHFIAYTRAGTTCSLIVDGVTVKSNTCPTNAINTALLSIGAKDTYVQTTGLDFTRGTIDEVRIFNRKLSDSELTSIRNNEHNTAGTVTRNLVSLFKAGEEIKELGCYGTWDSLITKVDVMASADNNNWVTIKSSAAPNVNYPVSTGNNYKYSRCFLSTTDSSKTPVIQSIRANIGPKGSTPSNPIAEANGPYTGTPGVIINFIGSASGGNAPYSYAWNFGDGGTSSLANPSHAYTNPGSYTATLTVTDNTGKTSSPDSALVSVASTNVAGSISGFLINDINKNGKWDIGESGIQGWKIKLVSKNNKKLNKKILTDVMGFYIFDNLPAGKYTVNEDNKKGWKHTNSKSRKIVLSNGMKSENNNFTNRKKG